MASSRATSNPAQQVRDYLAGLPAHVRRAVRRLGTIVRAAAPGAVQAFGYGIPAFRLDGRPLVYYAGWTQHTSLYPLTAAMRRAAGDALKEYDTARGTIRFPLSEPLPAALIARLVKARAAEMRSERRT